VLALVTQVCLSSHTTRAHLRDTRYPSHRVSISVYLPPSSTA
jgi:hypothetical protein